jgi:hypothetical protein
MCVSVLLYVSSGNKPFYSLSTFIFSGAAKHKQFLRMIGITHILNASEGDKLGLVDTSEGYSRDTNIR